MRVYIAGPMTGIKDYNYPRFAAAADDLRIVGHIPVNPTGPLIEGWVWRDYMRRALTQMLTADAVALLDGWEHSPGARLEYDVAHQLGIPTHPLDDFIYITPEGNVP